MKRMGRALMGDVKGKVGMFCMLAVMAVTSFSVDADAACAGKLYFKAPSDWSDVYVVFEQISYQMTTMEDGYYTIDLASLGGHGWQRNSFGISDSKIVNSRSNMVGSKYWNVVSIASVESDNIKCSDAGKSIFIVEDPLYPGQTHISIIPSNGRSFYLKVPQTEDWAWTTPMIKSNDESIPDFEMAPVVGRCGWFRYVWDAGLAPEEVNVYSKKDSSVKLEMIPLNDILSDEATALYYDGQSGDMDYSDPGSNGSCAFNRARLYFLPPSEKNWSFSTPVIIFDDALESSKQHYMNAAPGMCGWYYYEWPRGTVPPASAYIIRNTDTTDHIGVNGFSGSFAQIPIKQMFFEKGVSELYYVPEEGNWIDDKSKGWYTKDPGVAGLCEFKIAAVIYDTDESLNPLFSSDGNTSGFGACTGVRHGIVKTDLGLDGKPVFNEGNTNAVKCAGDSTKFKTLFNYTEGVNEVQCYDLPFRHYGDDPRWGFDSDSAVTGEYVGGFYPVENTSDATVVTSISPKPCPNCRYKRAAMGPVPVRESYASYFEEYCNTPGWFGGRYCEGYFNNGDNPAIWDWGKRSWGGDSYVYRNQQYCFESHVTFTYQENQTFTFRGDDDLWVFIGGKLAIDNGGAHLAAPGHVVLQNLNKTYGEGFLVPGKDYPLDIFYCDRRTTMTNMTIKTNVAIKQGSTGIDYATTKNKDGSVTYNICYDKSGSGDCASVALGGASGYKATIHACGKNIGNYGKLKYTLVSSEGEIVATLTPGKKGMQYGGVNLEDPFTPKITMNKMTGATPGSYRLVIDFCTISGICDTKASASINLKISDSGDDEDFVPKAAKVTQFGSYAIIKSGPSSFKIVSTRLSGNAQNSYAVLDMQGNVIQKGVVNGIVTEVRMPNSGAFVVRIGNFAKRIDIK